MKEAYLGVMNYNGRFNFLACLKIRQVPQQLPLGVHFKIFRIEATGYMETEVSIYNEPMPVDALHPVNFTTMNGWQDV